MIKVLILLVLISIVIIFFCVDFNYIRVKSNSGRFYKVNKMPNDFWGLKPPL